MLHPRTALFIAEMVISASGFAVLALCAGWKVALGVGLVVWGNNFKIFKLVHAARPLEEGSDGRN